MNILQEIINARNYVEHELENGNNVVAIKFIAGVLRYYDKNPSEFASEELKKEINDIVRIFNLLASRVSVAELISESESALNYLSRFKLYGFSVPEEGVQIITLYETIANIDKIANMNNVKINHISTAKEIIDNIFDDEKQMIEIESGIRKYNKFYVSI